MTSKNADNVVLFPGMQGRANLPQTVDEVKKTVKSNRADFINQMLYEFGTVLLTELVNSGATVDKNFYVRYAYGIEVFRAILYEDLIGQEHDMQKSIRRAVKKFAESEHFDKIQQGLEQMGLDDDAS